jgi:hypothetical protein
MRRNMRGKLSLHFKIVVYSKTSERHLRDRADKIWRFSYPTLVLFEVKWQISVSINKQKIFSYTFYMIYLKLKSIVHDHHFSSKKNIK